MSDVAVRDAALVELRLTTVGWLKANGQPRYPSGTAPATTHWGKAMTLLGQISSANAAPRDAAVVNLKKTTKGYNTTGNYWVAALAELAKIVDAPVDTWVTIAAEDAPFTLAQTMEVRYGKDPTWTSKTLSAGTYRCDNATFGDPLVGTIKHCEARSTTPPAPGSIFPSNTLYPSEVAP